MSIAPQLPQVRPLSANDADEAGDILYQAFSVVYDRRSFRPPFPSPEAGAWLVRAYLDLDPQGAVAAARGPRLDGLGFVHVRGAVASIGPVAARPGAPGGTGRAIMERLLALADEAGARTVRLFQDAFNPDSFALYAKLGFAAREAVAYAVVDRARAARNAPAAAAAPAGRIRQLKTRDLEAVLRLDKSLGGADRRVDFQLILQAGVAFGLVRGGDLTGFLFVREGAARVALAPGAAREPLDLLALVAHAAAEFPGRALSARVPAAPPELLRALLGLGFHVDHLGNLMVRGADVRSGTHLHAMFPESL